VHPVQGDAGLGDLDDEGLDAYDVPTESEDIAKDVMTAQVLTVPSDATLQQVARVMVDKQVHRLLVEDHRRTVGIVSTMDLLRAAAK